MRLVTLTGPGGVGKTRLALRVAHDLVQEFSGTVHFVPRATISDPSQVVPAIMHALDVRDDPARPAVETLAEAIGDDLHLIVLDNMEQAVAHGDDGAARDEHAGFFVAFGAEAERELTVADQASWLP
jgi:predicted ATPase